MKDNIIKTDQKPAEIVQPSSIEQKIEELNQKLQNLKLTKKQEQIVTTWLTCSFNTKRQLAASLKMDETHVGQVLNRLDVKQYIADYMGVHGPLAVAEVDKALIQAASMLHGTADRKLFYERFGVTGKEQPNGQVNVSGNQVQIIFNPVDPDED